MKNNSNLALNRIGTISHDKYGKEAVCCDYNNSRDMDAYFPIDGVIGNYTWHSFVHGKFVHPNDRMYPMRVNGIDGMDESQRKASVKKFIGKKGLSADMFVIEIIEANDRDNITVRFEDGTIVKNCALWQFKGAKIKHP